MTNLEYIQSCTKEELAKFICKLIGDCEACIAKDICFYKHNGLYIWLDKEVSANENIEKNLL